MLSIKGPIAEVRWGYHKAASLSGWHLTADPNGTRLSATIADQDAVKVSQRPLTFVVPRPTVPWRWPIQSLQIAGNTLTAELGPQQE